LRKFHISSDEEIRNGETTDIYFVRTEEILHRHGLDKRRAIAEFTVGTLPKEWKWGVFCGLEEVLTLFEGDRIDLYAMPEGTVFPARDIAGVRVPVMVIDGCYGDYCIYETPALGLICQASGIASTASRIRKAAGDKLLVSFGIRRMHPSLSPMIDRASYIGGCNDVSSLSGARMIDRKPLGTMPHSLIIVFESQIDAWKAFDETISEDVPRIALIDTYSDEKTESLMAVETLGKSLNGVRLDTPDSRRGNFADIVREVRWELNLRGYEDVRIIVSGGINEMSIPDLIESGVDGFGVGTSISSASTIDFAMDIVELDGKPCAKRGKFGGRKEVWRCERCSSMLVLPYARDGGSCPVCGGKIRRLLKQYIKNGRIIEDPQSPDEIREYVLRQLEHLDL